MLLNVVLKDDGSKSDVVDHIRVQSSFELVCDLLAMSANCTSIIHLGMGPSRLQVWDVHGLTIWTCLPWSTSLAVLFGQLKQRCGTLLILDGPQVENLRGSSRCSQRVYKQWVRNENRLSFLLQARPVRTFDKNEKESLFENRFQITALIIFKHRKDDRVYCACKIYVRDIW